MIHAAEQLHRNRYRVIYLVFLLGVLILSIWLVSSSAFKMAQTTGIINGALVSKNSQNDIIKTAQAEDSIPLAYSPLLDKLQIARVVELVVANLKAPGGGDGGWSPCETCPKYMIMQVDVALKYSDTKVKFMRTDGMEVEVNKGNIYVKKVPLQDPSTTFSACGLSTCSQIKVKGVNKVALHQKAKYMNFANVGMGRRFLAFAGLAAGAALAFKPGRDLICSLAPAVGAKMRCTLITEHKAVPPKQYMDIVVAGKKVCEDNPKGGFYTLDQCREGAFFCMKYGFCLKSNPSAINPLCKGFVAGDSLWGYEMAPRNDYSISEADYMAKEGLTCPEDGCVTPAPTVAPPPVPPPAPPQPPPWRSVMSSFRI